MPVPIARSLNRKYGADRSQPPPLHAPSVVPATNTATTGAAMPVRVATPGLNLPPQVDEVDPSDRTTFPSGPNGAPGVQFT